MKKLLLIVAGTFVAGQLFAQKLEVTGSVTSNLFRYGGKSAESVSYFNGSGNSYYTNNTYGNKNAFGVGAGIEAKWVAKCGFLFGLQAGYEEQKSKIDINGVSVNYTGIVVFDIINPHVPATGSTYLKNNTVNINPFAGYRLRINDVNVDLLAGADLGFITSAHEKGKAVTLGGAIYTTDMDRTSLKKDVRLRFGLAAMLHRFSLNASYSRGFTNYFNDYVGGSLKAHSEVVRLGVGYRIF